MMFIYFLIVYDMLHLCFLYIYIRKSRMEFSLINAVLIPPDASAMPSRPVKYVLLSVRNPYAVKRCII
jgi:hypothetical protein